MNNNIIKNKYGYYEVKDKPSEEELETYYSKYYQNNKGHYSNDYDNEEKKYLFNKIAQKYDAINSINPSIKNKRLLDIGCGEGWALSFFKEKGFEITGLDYNKHGCNYHNKSVSNYVIEGNIFSNLDQLIKKNNKYAIIWLDNVLEHVLNPIELLNKISLIADDSTLLVIEVPNDFSVLHEQLLNDGHIDKEFWVVVPDHLSYFNMSGLVNLCEDCNWQSEKILGDFLIDMLLLNNSTNYITDKSKGKDCHRMRIKTENLLSDISLSKTNDLHSILADMGLGRSIIGFFSIK